MLGLDGLELRPVARADAAKLVELFATGFGSPVTPAYFEWKYERSPWGKAIAFVADAGDRLAGFYGLIPEPWSVAGEITLVHQAADAVTHPDFRRRGLSVELAQHTYAAARRNLEPLVLVATPGPASRGAFVGPLGWTVARELEFIGVPSLRFRVGRAPRDLEAIEVADPHPDVERVLSSAPPTGPAAPSLAGNFFDWRVYGQSPTPFVVTLARRGGEPVGVVVSARTSTRTLLIAYVAGIREIPLSAWLPGTLRSIATNQGGHVVYTWRPQRADLAEQYRSLGFRTNRLPLGPLRERRWLVVRSDEKYVRGVRWADASAFDLQPLMQS
ncbi:MAG: GNAT family N-acetyltransferase [Solirubrobacteraceae bacterium]